MVNPILTSLDVPIGGHFVVSSLRMLSCFEYAGPTAAAPAENAEYSSNTCVLLKDLSINDSIGSV